jgi:hypothetical protein
MTAASTRLWTALAAVLATLAVTAGPATALVVPQTVDQNMTQVVDFLKDGSAHRDPSNSYLRAKERLAANTAQPTQLQRDLLSVRQRASLLPKFSGAFTAVTLGATAGYIGWKIGSGVRAKFMEMPKPVAAADWTRLVPREHDELVHSTDYQPGGPLGRSVWRVETSGENYEVWSGTAVSDPDCDFKELASFATGWLGNTAGPVNMCNGPNGNTGNGQRAVSYLDMDSTLKDYDGEAVTFATGAGVEPTAAAVEAQLRSDIEADRLPALTPWLDNQLGGPSANPTSGPMVTVPSCTGDSYSACKSKLEAEGFTTDRVVLSFNGADVTKPANAVVEIAPAAGSTVDSGSEVTITTNPDTSAMPLLTPAPEAGESYASYVARLQAAGHVGTVTRVDLSETTMDPSKGPSAVTSTEPGSGTRIAPDFPVRVRVNPDTAPAVSGSGGGTGNPAVHTINLAPLNVAAACDNFPFGVPCWLYDVAEAWVVGTPDAPSWEVPFPFVAAASYPSIDLQEWNAYAVPLRALILLVAAVGMALKFYALATGSSRGGDGD